MPTVDEKKLDE
jgi:hypothetical protein